MAQPDPAALDHRAPALQSAVVAFEVYSRYIWGVPGHELYAVIDPRDVEVLVARVGDPTEWRRQALAGVGRSTGGRHSRRPAGEGADLVARRREVARLAAAGRTRREIANEVHVSMGTVSNDLAAIKREPGRYVQPVACGPSVALGIRGAVERSHDQPKPLAGWRSWLAPWAARDTLTPAEARLLADALYAAADAAEAP